MSDEIERLLVRVEANAAQFEAQMKKINRSIHGSQAETRKALNAIKRDTTAMSRTMFQPVGDAFRKEIAGLSGILAGLFTAKEVMNYADAWTDMTGRMRLAVDEGVSVEDSMGRLADMAVRSYSAIETTSEAYFRNAGTMRALGYATDETFDYVEALNNALVVSGAKGQRAESVMTALSKAMAKGGLEGDNLQTVIESGGRVAELIAEKLGVTTLQLAKLGKEGQITGKVLYEALAGSLPKLRQEADSMAATVADAMQNLRTAVIKYVGEADASLGASARMAAAITALSDNLDTIVPIVVTLAGLIGGAYAASLTVAAVRTALATANSIAYQAAQIRLIAAISGTTTAQLAFNVALASNPIGIVITAVAALAAGLFILSQRQKEMDARVQSYRDNMNGARDALQRYDEAARNVANATKENAKQMREAAEAARLDALYRLESARAIRAQTAALAEQRAREALEADRAANRGGTPYPGMQGGQAVRAGQVAQQARREADAAREAEQAAGAEYDRIANKLKSGGYRAEGVVSSGGIGGGSSGGAANSDAKRIADLRTRLELEEQMAAARATGDAKAIAAEEERQRLIELTERYRAAGYADAASRAMQLLAAENQAKDVEESRERLAERRKEHAEWEANLRRQALDWTQRQYDQELDLARIQGDPAVIRKLEREAELRQRIAEYVERFGMAGYGLAVSKQMQVDGARDGRDADERLTDNARTAARHFVDVLAADSWAEAAGHKFKQAAFDGLEDLFSIIFKQMGSGEGGGFFGSIAKGIGTFFGGGRASGGPVTAGRAYRINENTAKSEIFVPSISGRIVTDAQAASGQGANRVRGGVVEHRVIVVPDQDSFIRLAGDVAQPMADMARAGAFGDVASASAASQRRAALRTRRR